MPRPRRFPFICSIKATAEGGAWIDLPLTNEEAIPLRGAWLRLCAVFKRAHGRAPNEHEQAELLTASIANASDADWKIAPEALRAAVLMTEALPALVDFPAAQAAIQDRIEALLEQ